MASSSSGAVGSAIEVFAVVTAAVVRVGVASAIAIGRGSGGLVRSRSASIFLRSLNGDEKTGFASGALTAAALAGGCFRFFAIVGEQTDADVRAYADGCWRFKRVRRGGEEGTGKKT